LAKIGQNAQQDKSIYQFNPIQSNPRFASTNPSTTSSSRLLDDCCKKSPFGTYVYLPAGWHHRRRRQLLGIQIKNCDPNLVAGYPRKLANCSVEHDKAPNGRRTSSPSESQLRTNKQTNSLSRIRCPRGGFQSQVDRCCRGAING